MIDNLVKIYKIHPEELEEYIFKAGIFKPTRDLNTMDIDIIIIKNKSKNKVKQEITEVFCIQGDSDRCL